MRNEHFNYLQMCARVKKFFRRHDAVLDVVRGMNHLIARIVQLSGKMSEEFDNAVIYTRGYSIERARKREALQDQCLMFTKYFVKVAESIKYKPVQALSDMVYYDLNEMNLMSEEELIDYAASLYDLCDLLHSRLKAIGVYQKAIDGFARCLTAFALDYPMNKHSESLRRQSSLLMLKAYDDLQDVFVKSDQCIEGFRNSNPLMYADYLKARTIYSISDIKEPDFQARISGDQIHLLAEMPYDAFRQILLSVEGGNAIWGLGNSPRSLDHARPVSEFESLCLKSSLIGPRGDYLMIQAVNPNKSLFVRVWICDF